MAQKDSDHAIAIAMGDRFFTRVTPTGRLLTAWSLAGARLFGHWDEAAMSAAEAAIAKCRRQSQRVTVRALRPFYNDSDLCVTTYDESSLAYASGEWQEIEDVISELSEDV